MMTRTTLLLISLFLSIGCFGQAHGITKSEVLDLRECAVWASISNNDQLLTEYGHLDSLQILKINYQSDTLEVEGFIVAPLQSKNLPIVIFNRGGNRDYFNISEETLVDWIAPIARHGFAVFASQYRDKDEFGGSDINDVLNLMEVAKNYPGTDSTKIGMVGWSRGGLMTYLALTLSDEIDCAIIGGAPTNMIALVQERPSIDALLESLVPAYTQNRMAELEHRSPALWPEKLHETHLLILHGQEDKKVSYFHATSMSETLDGLGYDHTLIIFENDDHILRNNKELKDREIARWLLESLKVN